MIRPLFQNVLIVLNGSEASIKAAKYGILMAKLYRCNLKAVYVVDTVTLKQLTVSKFFVPEESKEYEMSLTSDGERYLNYVSELAASKSVKISTELCYGGICSEIINAAEEMKADLILLGGRENGCGRFDVLSHSYTEIMNHSECSVLVVNEKKIDQIYKMA